MAAKTRAALKAFFETGDQPTSSEFADLMDSVPNKTDDGETGTGSFVRATSPALTTPALTGPTIVPSTPASAGATGVAGTVAIDSNYIYVCTATNTWKRAALSTW